jgi:hypothetical protein
MFASFLTAFHTKLFFYWYYYPLIRTGCRKKMNFLEAHKKSRLLHYGTTDLMLLADGNIRFMLIQRIACPGPIDRQPVSQDYAVPFCR